MKTKGFTLAEVLITLTIIGVIAAITIPNLMQSWRKHERITQIKTAYSIIQNAVRMSVAENGSPNGWTYGTAENAGQNGSEIFAPRYILPYLKYQYICGIYGTDKRCFDNNGWKDLNGNVLDSASGGYGPTSFYQVKLQNGMDLGIWAQTPNYAAVNGNGGYHLTLYVFDVNGSKGPNQAGNDVFGFAMDDRDGIVRTFNPADVNGVHVMGTSNDIHTLLNSSYKFACSKNSQFSGGIGCTRVIELNGWEFPENYPVKKF